MANILLLYLIGYYMFIDSFIEKLIKYKILILPIFFISLITFGSFIITIILYELIRRIPIIKKTIGVK